MNTLLTQLQSSRVNLETNKNNRSKTNNTSHNPRDLAGLELGRLPLLPKMLAVVRKINKKELAAYIQTTQHSSTQSDARPRAPLRALAARARPRADLHRHGRHAHRRLLTASHFPD